MGLDNYIRIFTKDATFLKSLGNTLYIMLLGFPLSIFLGLVIAAFLSNLKKFRNLFQTLNFLPYITTPVAIGLIFTFLFDWNTGIVNRVITFFGGEGINWLGSARFAPMVIGFMIIWKCTGYYMALYLSGITSISSDIYEAAKVDGASGLQTLLRVILPSIKPVLTTTLILDTVWWFKHYTIIQLLTKGGPGNDTSIISIEIYKQAFEYFKYGKAAAISVVVFLICLLITKLYRRFLESED